MAPKDKLDSSKATISMRVEDFEIIKDLLFIAVKLLMLARYKK